MPGIKQKAPVRPGLRHQFSNLQYNRAGVFYGAESLDVARGFGPGTGSRPPGQNTRGRGNAFKLFEPATEGIVLARPAQAADSPWQLRRAESILL